MEIDEGPPQSQSPASSALGPNPNDQDLKRAENVTVADVENEPRAVVDDAIGQKVTSMEMDEEGAENNSLKPSVVLGEPQEKDEVKCTTEKIMIVPLSSPRIPSLGQTKKTPSEAKVKDQHVSDKEILPSNLPQVAFEAKDEMNGQTDGQLLAACTKSLSSALAKPASFSEAPFLEKDQKRKLRGGCSNVNCSTNSNDLVIARRAAMIYFQFNTAYKKIHKICTNCEADAEKFLEDAVTSLKNQKGVFAASQPKPQGMDGDVIEVQDDEEDDDPEEVNQLQSQEREIINLPFDTSLDAIIGDILKQISLDDTIDKCEKSVADEGDALDDQFSRLEKQISLVEKQIGETKKMYDKVTGHYQPMPVVTSEVDIGANGIVKTSSASNPQLDLSNKSTSELLTSNRPDLKPRKAKENRPSYIENADDREEILEIETRQPHQLACPCPLTKPPATIPRTVPKVGNIVYAQSKTLIHFWLKGEVTDVVQMGQGRSPEFVVRLEKNAGQPGSSRHQIKQVTSKQIAYNIPCPFTLLVGTRIIAKFRDELNTDPDGDGQYYAGIVAEPPSLANHYRYLIFFDDGYAQYVHYNDVLLVYEHSKEVWTDVYSDSSDFIRNYVRNYPERPMVRMSPGQVISTEWNGKWWVARVLELDASLVKMKFENDGRCEWIYRGSTRLSPLFEKHTRQKQRKQARRSTSAVLNKNQPRIEYNYGSDELMPEEKQKSGKPTARKSTSGVSNQVLEKQFGDIRRLARLDYGEFEGSIIKCLVPNSAPPTLDLEPHVCNGSCVNEYDDSNKEYKKMSPLAIPLYLGFSREVAKMPRRSIFYRGPCGLRLRNLEELYDYLTQTKCGIPIDHFCFDLAVDCLNEFRHTRQHSFLPDLTYGKENAPVQVVNAFDYEYPPYVEYASQRIPGAGVHLNTDDGFLVGCDCQDDCRDKSKCSCWQMTFSGISFTKLQNPECPVQGYEYRRLKDHIVSGVYECNPRCKCASTCCNRVAQNGLKVPLQVFKTATKGWGIRPLFDVAEGAFICIYAGQVLTDAGANEDGKQFGDEYLAELDYIESIEMVKADYESDCTDIETEEPGTRSSQRKTKRGPLDDDSDDNESDEGDGAHRGLKQNERTVTTRSNNKNGKNSKLSDSDDDEGGTHPRSHFNADVSAYRKSKVVSRKPLREYFGEDEECYIMDAKTTGNIGRYLNHSCQPNVFVQNVFVDTHDLRFPWVAFFASKHIRAGSELTWDYNYEIGSVPNKVLFCYCGSPDCRGRLL